jgi:hypothetical protein
VKVPCFRSSSIRSLLAETKAISIPENRAENRIDNPIIKGLKSIILVDPPDLSDIFFFFDDEGKT